LTGKYYVHYYVHMDSKYIISISEARRRIFEIANEVQKPNTHYIFTENGKPKAVILSVVEFESLLETIEVLEEFPDLDKNIVQLERDIESGEVKNYKTLEEVLEQEGFVMADKGKETYGISSTARPKGRKRSRKSSKK
jgi:antitoxin YefM